MSIFAISLSLSSCIKKPLIPKEPKRIQFGNAGQQPTEVWMNYGWRIEAIE